MSETTPGLLERYRFDNIERHRLIASLREAVIEQGHSITVQKST